MISIAGPLFAVGLALIACSVMITPPLTNRGAGAAAAACALGLVMLAAAVVLWARGIG